MAVTNKKLEELIYLSLIGRYTLKQESDFQTILSFVDDRQNKLRPIYQTKLDSQSTDNSVKKSIKSFEDKVFSQSKYIMLYKFLDTKHDINGVNFINRISSYLCDIYTTFPSKERKIIKGNYTSNIQKLCETEVIDKKQSLVALELFEELTKNYSDVNDCTSE